MTYKSLTLDGLENRYDRFPTDNWPYVENGEKYGLGYY